MMRGQLVAASRFMRLTKQTDYSLRVLMHLALLPEQKYTIRELSERYKVSKNHLMKVVNQLARLGYIKTERGRVGGLRLARPSSTIRIGAVVSDIEPTLDVIDCNAGEGCILQPACKLQYALKDASRAFIRTLNNYTLADLVANEEQLLRLVS